MTTIKINNETTEVPAGAVAWKYADPTEGARWIYDREEADDVTREDPGLIVWVPPHDSEIFGRPTDEGHVRLFHSDGEVVTQLNATVWPVGSDLSARYEHPEGIVLTRDDARKIGVLDDPSA